MSGPEQPGDAPVGGGTDPQTVMRTSSTSGVVRASSVMAVGTLVSRVTGFLAKVVLLAFLGAWVVSDSYNLANTLPNIIFELLVGGVLASVAIPLLSRARSDPDGGTAYTQRLMTMAVVALLLATAAATAAAPLLIRLYQGDSSNADPAMATHLAYLLLPQIFFYGIAALFGAILNTKERFVAPAWAPVANNLVVIAVGILLFTTSGGVLDPAHGLANLSRSQFLLLGAGTTLGIVLQAAILLPSLRRTGFRFAWRWGVDSRMVEAGRLMGWAIAYALVSQLGYIVTVRVAYAAGDDLHTHGLYTLYWYGSMLFQLPYGILGVSLLTAIMPRMSRHAADGQMQRVKHDMSLANRLSTVALLPVTAAMIALAVPLATVTAQYGKVTTADARILAFTLAAFAIGLLPLAITLVQMRVFYAMKDGRTPTIINAIMVAVRIPLLLACVGLPTRWVVPGLAAAMSASYIVGVAVGEVWLRVRFGSMGFGATLWTIARTALASAVAGLAAWWVTDALLPVDAATFGGAVASLAVGGLVGLALVAVGLIVLRVDEARSVVERLRRRVGRSAPDPESERGTLEETTTRGGPPRGGTGASGTAGDGGDDATGTPGTTGTTSTTSTDLHSGRQGQVSVTDPQRQTLFAPGATIGGRYRLTTLIATDEAGREYWRSRDTVLPRDMALTLLPGMDHTAPVVGRTLQAGRLHHPGLPRVMDVGSTGGGTTAAYIVSPWADGATLVELVDAGPLDPALAASLTAKVTDAVETAHRGGISFGALPPALVRINSDGQTRLSHVVAQPEATEADDIRAAGALLYLMLTGTWPLPSGGAPGLDPAPRQGDREQPASEVNPAVPQALAALADRALHPLERQGIQAIGAMTTLLRPRGAGADEDNVPAMEQAVAQALGSPSDDDIDDEPDRPRRRRSFGTSLGAAVVDRGAPGPALARERHVKLGIAGGMILVLVVLMVIVLSAVAKQMLTSIAEPIQRSDAQPILQPTTPTTTRTVGTTTKPSTSSHSSTTSGHSTETSTSTSRTPKAKPVKVAGAVVYDPQGTPPKDFEAYIDRAFDGDQATYWLTWVYNQQFGPGGIKDGVGLLMSFDKAITPASVTVSTGTPGTGVEILSADSADPDLDDTTVLGKADLDNDPVSITLSDAPKSKYLIMWITKLAPYQGDSAKNQGKFQSNITEISVTGF